jgi:hypothetical protein
MAPNFDDDKTKIQNLLNQLTPDQQTIARDYARLKLENKHLKRAYEIAEIERRELYAIMVVLLHASETRELRIHETQFLRFEAEYRIESKFDHETRERVLRLLTLKDETVN